MSTIKNNKKKTAKPARPRDDLGLALPAASAPDAPAVLTPMPRGRHVIVMDAHVLAAERVAAEIEASATYAADFGKCGPAPQPVSEGLRIARAWSGEQARADAWRAYVSQERERSWTEVMGALAPLLKGFDGAVARDPSILERYPALARFVAARQALGARSAAKRKKNEKAKAHDVAAAPAPSSPAATSPAKSAA